MERSGPPAVGARRRRRPSARVIRRRRQFAVGLVALVALLVSTVVWALTGGNGHEASSRRPTTTRPVPARQASTPARFDVVAENRRPGTSGWRIPPGADTNAITGYADRVSAAAGDTAALFVRSASPYRVEAYRMGWYHGAGARLVWRSEQLPAVAQPKASIAPDSRMVETRWKPSVHVAIDSAFVPGDYLLKLVAASGAQHYVPLTVRDDAGHHDLLLINAVTTWQAYNDWGGYDLYNGPRADPKLRSKIVSFDRPYARDGSADFLGNEYPAVSLAEQLGLDVSYTTSVDLHAHPERLLDHHALVSLGHDEYWSLAMRDGVGAARDHGVNLAFLGANAVFRRIRLTASAQGPFRHEVNYRVAKLDPMLGRDDAQVTTSWREAPAARPESSLLGVMYECNPVQADGIVVDGTSWVFAGSVFVPATLCVGWSAASTTA